MKLFFLVVVTLTLISCQLSPSKKQSAQVMPSWYLNPPADTQFELYGVGMGTTPDKAIKDALAYLADKLSVSVSSTTSINKTLQQGIYDFSETELKKQTSINIKQVEINQFMQLEMVQVGYENFITLINSNKTKLANDFQNQLNLQMNKYQHDNDMHNNKSGYLKYMQALLHYNKLSLFINKLNIFRSLSPNSDLQKYQQHIKEVSSFLKQQQNQTTFKITANKVTYQKTLANYVTKLGFKISKKKLELNTNLIKLKIKEKITNAEGFNIVRSQLKISFYEQNKTKSGNILGLKGQGLNTSQSNNDIQNKLSKTLNIKGLNSFLGME